MYLYQGINFQSGAVLKKEFEDEDSAIEFAGEKMSEYPDFKVTDTENGNSEVYSTAIAEEGRNRFYRFMEHLHKALDARADLLDENKICNN